MIYLGDDKGAGANKLYGPHGGGQIPARVASCKGQLVGRMAGMRTTKPPMKVETKSGEFYVGATAHDWGWPVENLDHSRLTGTPEMVALTYASWTKYMRANGQIDEPVTIVAGLPIGALEGSEADASVRAVKRWMTGNHVWQADGKECALSVEAVKVTSQATGALFDHLLDDEGAYISNRKKLAMGEVGVISIGFNTVEIMAVRDKAHVPRLTTSVTSGVRRLLDLTGTDYSLGELDAMLRRGRLDVASVLPVWGREVTGAIEKTWGQQWRRFERVLLVGGGAILLRDILTRHFAGKGIMPDDPVISIARGLYKLALNKSRRK